MTLGISYIEFRQIRTEYWNESYGHTWQTIQRLDLGADLIFCGFCEEIPVIIRLDRFGRSPWETNYSVIGEGSEVARAMLSLQEWSAAGSSGDMGPVQPAPLDHCLFRLYEAKTAAHRAHPSSVGAATAFHVMVSGKGRFGVTDYYSQALADAFQGKHVVPDLHSLWAGMGIRKQKARKHTDLLVAPGKDFQI